MGNPELVKYLSDSHLASVEFITKGSSKFLPNSSTNGAVDRLLDLAGCTGHAHVILQYMTVHFQPELEVRRNLIAVKHNAA
jgi:hypothetical protein